MVRLRARKFLKQTVLLCANEERRLHCTIVFVSSWMFQVLRLTNAIIASMIYIVFTPEESVQNRACGGLLENSCSKSKPFLNQIKISKIHSLGWVMQQIPDLKAKTICVLHALYIDNLQQSALAPKLLMWWTKTHMWLFRMPQCWVPWNYICHIRNCNKILSWRKTTLKALQYYKPL